MDVMNPAVAAHSGLGKVNPAIKLALGLLLTASFLVSADWLTATIGGASLVAVMASSRINPWNIVVRLWPVFLAALFSGWATAILAPKTGQHLLELGPLLLTSDSLNAGVAIALRGGVLAMISVLLLLTTDAREIGDALAQTFKLPARFVLSAVAAFRLVGIVIAEWETLAAARRARGLGSDRGLIGRITGFGSQAFALIVQSLRRASRLAVTMEARGFGAGPRTWVNRPTYSWRDVVALCVGIAIPAVAIGTSWALGVYRFFH
ncbi:energy-coupling factor transporter transmembrane component T family protein [Kocuria massiliensis]|uniref:energy-coupling factor transporter transmembrane component T family protein n=1 Tax=Kocuria massiliensis TaxID=1926282 RepID=UPI00117B9EB2|nr:energy-coupling factor transporter transmembrane component T [Kocuria massiliensis]